MTLRRLYIILVLHRLKMPTKNYKILRTIIIVISAIWLSFGSAVAQHEGLKEQAGEYRDQGYQAQINGDLETAIGYYKKAITIDPFNAVAHNDLGVIYEIKGFKEKAEEHYLQSIKLDPYSQSAYFNLANLYEEQGDLRRAAGFWKKRIELGDPNDPWTQKAILRLQNIGMLIEDIGWEIKQQQIQDLMFSSPGKDFFDVTGHETAGRKYKARNFFISAKTNYSIGNYVAALKDANAAAFLDPSNSEIEKFIEKIRKRMDIYAH